MTLHAAFNRRYVSIVEHSKIWRVPPPDKDALYQKLESAVLDGFQCCYCGRKLKIQEPRPSLSVFSFDHYQPFARGGYNTIENIVICCHSCNIIKGTMSGGTFKELLRYVPSNLVGRMFTEIWQGRIADKLDRVALEKV